MASISSNTGVPAAASPAQQSSVRSRSNRLGAFLCWAVVFADIGTSVYYVPGILYGQVNRLAGLFVIMTLVVFLLLTLKYAEVSVRFPEGGGVVTVAAHGLNPWAGAVGGMFILVDYFLTSSISSLSGLQYFQTLIPGIAPYVLIATIVVLLLLGVLNWYGIKESAIFSATIAVAAFISDLLILLFVFLRVPPHIIGMVFQEMFSGHHLTVPIVLTGFAGAFLAFSGLESISQLSPVMKTPRHKTVTWALALVVITVGITSPLLTVFSTTLLTDPAILRATNASASLLNGPPDPNQFISELGLAYGGKVLAILTAITASILLIFASNTAIIGAYHVFLALSRMRFFPKIVEYREPHRDTPLISIILATVIPIVVLIAVRGDINKLGDMYAFGLLGAFSLTCLSLDVIRWRERRGEIIAPLQDDPNEPDDYANSFGERLVTALRTRFTSRSIEPTAQVAVGQTVAGQQPSSSVRRKVLWANIKYYLGFLTTILVGVAWVTNLKVKPLATVFGGGLTLLGLGIMVINYRRQERAGLAPVFGVSGLRRFPNALLVVLTGGSPYNRQVIEAATESADGHTLVYLYLGTPSERDVRRLEFNDPYLFDTEAQETLSIAAGAARRTNVSADYVYRTGGLHSVLDAWRIVRPDEIIADANTAKAISKIVAPQYVRFQQVDGVRVAHYVKHYVEGLNNSTVPANGMTSPSKMGPPSDIPAAPDIPKESVTDNDHLSDGKAAASVGQLRNVFGEHQAQASEQHKQNGRHEHAETGASSPAATQPTEQQRSQPLPDEAPAEDAQPSGSVDVSDYVWTGTSLVRKDELAAREAQEAANQEQHQQPEDTPPSTEPENPQENRPEN